MTRSPRLLYWGVANALVAAVACVHRSPQSATAPVCAPATALSPAGQHLRIDGWFGATVNDSLVIILDGKEQWRGMYRLCSEAPASSTGIAGLPSTPDSVRSLYVVRGEQARQRYRIGGTNPSAMVIETLRN